MKKNKELVLSIIGILSILLATTLVSYAFFSYASTGTKDNVITTDNISFIYTETSGVGNGINIEDAFPKSDNEGKVSTKEGEYFDFKIASNTAKNASIPYEITARKTKDSTLNDNSVRVYLTKIKGTTEEEVLLDSFSDLAQTKNVSDDKYTEKIIYTGNVPANTSNYEESFRLRIWLDENIDFSSGDYNSKTFALTVNVYSNAKVLADNDTDIYTEEILNGADPVLTDNLIPVKILNDGSVVKASIKEDWYDYETKRWANAVVLRNDNATYQDGDTIEEDDIESYFVWIPKYSYQLWDLGNYTGLTTIESKEHAIPIKFGLANTSDTNTGECTTPGVAGESGNCQVGDYMTHPSFLAFNTNGLWIGKFETGFDGATADTTTEMNTYDKDKIIIKPNVYSWRRNTLGNMFKASLDYSRDNNSHMMKNTEWGSVAYLQHSNYGSATSVRLNNNSAYITGYAGVEEPMIAYKGGSIEGNRYEKTSLGVDGTYTVNYLNPKSVVASTTGNYTGIYDMSGGAWDYVMGYTTGASTVGGLSDITSLYSDFFTNVEYNKYYDKYPPGLSTNYNNRILGDATGEMGPFNSSQDPDTVVRNKASWYGDYSNFVYPTYSWFQRGGMWQHGTGAGIFHTDSYSGVQLSFTSFRIVLAPQSSNPEPLTLRQSILNKYSIKDEKATLTTTSQEANENGLYKSTLTNSGKPTYYFRGNVENYIDFAGFTWRVVRINEDGTIRIVMQDGINDNTGYAINSTYSIKDNMYYTNGDTAKGELEDWYNEKIASNSKYLNRVVTGEYYCEQAKIAPVDVYADGSGANMILLSVYDNPNFECRTDANGHGLVNASIGLLTYDELLHAGGYYGKENKNYYLYNNTYFWTMSPAGFNSSSACAHGWYGNSTGLINSYNVNDILTLRSVLNLKADTVVTGAGDSNNHWVVAN